MAETLAIQQTAEIAAEQAAEVAEALADNGSTDEEDYAWLTERLDALEANQREMLSQVATALERANNQPPSPELTAAMSSLEQTNRLLTEQLTTMQAQQTEMHTLVLSRLTPDSSTNSSHEGDSELTSELETPATESNPASGEQEPTPEQHAEPVGGKKRRRI